MKTYEIHARLQLTATARRKSRLAAIAAIIPALYDRAGKASYHPSRWEDGNPATIRGDYREAMALGSRAILGTPADRLSLLRQLHPSLRRATKIWGVQLRPVLAWVG